MHPPELELLPEVVELEDVEALEEDDDELEDDDPVMPPVPPLDDEEVEGIPEVVDDVLVVVIPEDDEWPVLVPPVPVGPPPLLPHPTTPATANATSAAEKGTCSCLIFMALRFDVSTRPGGGRRWNHHGVEDHVPPVCMHACIQPASVFPPPA